MFQRAHCEVALGEVVGADTEGCRRVFGTSSSAASASGGSL